MKFTKYETRGDYHWRQYKHGHGYKIHADKVKNWIKEKKVLDVGAGDGLITYLLGAKGIDNEPTGVKLAQKRGANVVLGDAYHLPNEEFETITMIDLLEHLEFPEKALDEAKRVAPYLYITTPVKGRKKGRFHYNEWSPGELKELVEKNGFILIELEVVGPPANTIYAKFKRKQSRKKVCLDLHDFSVVNNRLDLLLKLKEHFPEFKVALFTVARDLEADWGVFCIRKDLLKEIKKHLDWIQIIPHGLSHNKELEFCDYETFKNKIMPSLREAFEKDGLPFEKGFGAPHWRWSEGVVRALDEAGWWGAVDKNQPNMLSTKKFYRFSHGLHENYHQSNLEVLKLHGHVYGLKNDLGKCLGGLLELPKSVEWHFATDFLEP